MCAPRTLRFTIAYYVSVDGWLGYAVAAHACLAHTNNSSEGVGEHCAGGRYLIPSAGAVSESRLCAANFSIVSATDAVLSATA